MHPLFLFVNVIHPEGLLLFVFRRRRERERALDVSSFLSSLWTLCFQIKEKKRERDKPTELKQLWSIQKVTILRCIFREIRARHSENRHSRFFTNKKMINLKWKSKVSVI